tara:strand:+ start:92 stop:1036 length:945 start_codon:yes stop_codon:yes gene_type:complete
MFDLCSCPENFKSGFIALIGRPNVGKSTLLNRFLGEKVAITSPIAQTTRNRLRAILTTKSAQLVFVDTPGIHKPHHLLGERLVQSSKNVIGEVDLVLLILEACYKTGKGDAFIIDLLRKKRLPVVVALNKWDLVSDINQKETKSNYLNLIQDMSWPIYTCSAFTGEGCNQLIDSLYSFLPKGPYLYPPGIISDQPERVLFAELIREQVLLQTREEIPHSVAVYIDRVDEIKNSDQRHSQKKRTAILATILVERKSQKGILIGKGGSMLKNIGSKARLQMQALIDGQIYLELFVKVVPDWRSKPARLAELGFEGK